MKRTMLMTVAALVLTGAFAAAQEVELPDDYGILPEFGTLVSDMDYNIMDNGPIWSPDGGSTSFTDDQGKIWSAPLDGSEETLIYDNPPQVYQGVTLNQPWLHMINLCGYTPDGTEILFSGATIDEARGSVPEITYAGDQVSRIHWTPLMYLYAVNVETGAIRTVATGGAYGAYSPDGKYLAYSVSGNNTGDAFIDEHKRQIIIRNLETGTETFLPYRNERYFWTADSSALLISTGTTEMSRIPIDGSGPVTYNVEMGSMYSVDSQRSLLVMIKDDALFAVNYETGVKTRLSAEVAGEFLCPAISPDGTKMAYVVSFEGASHTNKYDTITRHHVFFMEIDSDMMFPTSVEDAAPAPELVIGNYPNPFNPTTAVIFSLPGEGIASLDIYSLSGQKVRELISGRLERGVHIISWDGRSADGSPLASGIYIARLTMGSLTATRRMMLMK